MKKIQELLLESEQLRLETDDAGPQVVAEKKREKLIICNIIMHGFECLEIKH